MSGSLNEALGAFVRVLAYVYASINWRRIKVKSPHDVWNHRVRAAVTRATVDEAVSRLCNYFSIQSLPIGAVLLLDTVRKHGDEVLDTVSRQHITRAMEAVIFAETLRRNRSLTQLREVWPLASWRWLDVWAYLVCHDVPYLALYDSRAELVGYDRARFTTLFDAEFADVGAESVDNVLHWRWRHGKPQ